MITFQTMSLFERMRRIFSPRYRNRKDAEMLSAIHELCRNPDMPCMVADEVIPNGYGELLQRAMT